MLQRELMKLQQKSELRRTDSGWSTPAVTEKVLE
jgi:hypothetical protein